MTRELRCESAERAAVVAEARTWLQTPYHHCADLKGVGVDCAMLLVRVYCDLGLVKPFDPRPYSPQWMLHHGEEKYLAFLLTHSRRVARAEVGLGDVVLFRFGRCFSHGGIVTKTDPLTIVHAFAPARRVVENDCTHSGLMKRPVKFASYWPPSPAPREKVDAPKARTDEAL
jgi:NlpC/P60 family putative phage cell wall peptidase